MSELGVILLAAGQGTRMKSTIPKVLHALGGKALFLHPLEVGPEQAGERVGKFMMKLDAAIRHATTPTAAATTINVWPLCSTPIAVRAHATAKGNI